MAQNDSATITTQPLRGNNNFQDEPKQSDLTKVPDGDVVTMQPMLAQDPLPNEGNIPKQADVRSRTHFCDVCLPLLECCTDCSDTFCFWMCCKITHSHHHYHEANGGGCCDDCCKCDNCCDCGDCDCGDCDCGDCDCGDCDCGSCDCDCL